MKMLRNLRLPSLVATAAIAGLCFTAAYAVPNYTPALNSPVNAPNADGVADLSFGLNAINSQLTGTATLVLPRANVPLSTAPTAAQLQSAVVAAFGAAGSVAEKAEILRSALFVVSSYKIGKDKDIVREVMKNYLASGGYSPANTITILEAGLVPNVKAGDLMAGAILAVGDVANTSREDDADLIASGVVGEAFALNYDNHLKAEALIAVLAEQAIKNVKPGSAGAGFTTVGLAADVQDMAKEIMSASVSSGGGFVVDNAARGIMKGAKALLGFGVTYPGVLSAISTGVGSDPVNRAHAVAGAVRDFKSTNTTEFAQVKAAFSDPLLDAVVDGFSAAVGVSGAGADTTRAGLFATYAFSNPAKAAHYALGAVSLSPSLAPLLATGMASVPSVSDKQRILAFVSRAAQSKAAAAAASSVTTGGLTTAQALQAALPNVTVTNSGAVASAVGKAVPSATGSSLIAAAINALETASPAGPEDDFKAGVIQSAIAILKLKRSDAVNGVISGGLSVADANAGTKEALAAAVGFFEPKVNHSSAIQTALGADPETSSVLLAEEVARNVKLNGKQSVTITLDAIRNASASNLAAVVIGAGISDPKSVHIFLASALRKGNGSLTSTQEAQILNNAKAISNKAQFNMQIAFDTAKSVLATPDELFETVDHQLIKYPKLGNVIAGAAAAAAPGYAHYVARAAGFRSTTGTAGTMPLEIIKGADMNANLNSNPSAIAAITAGFVSGIMDSKQATDTQTKLLQGAMNALVKAAVTYGTKTAPLFRGVNLGSGAAPGAANQPEYGSAAAVTGAVSVLTKAGDTGVFNVSASSTDPLTILLRAAGLAVGNAANSQMTVIAQAAAQAAVWASGTHGVGNVVTAVNAAYDINAIALAITQGAFKNNGLLTPNAAILAAATAGKAEALAGFKGAGAAGVLDYAHFNTNNSPVTDISNF